MLEYGLATFGGKVMKSAVKMLAVVAAATFVVPSAAMAKTLVHCLEGSPEGFNPQTATSTTAFDAAGLPIFDRLVEFVPGTTTVRPGLAESWDISPDGTVYTFKLRQGVRFHTTASYTPTRNFTADDVLFSFFRQWKTDHPYHKVNGGSYRDIDATGIASLLQSIEKVDDHTVRFSLKAPEAPFLADLAMSWSSILSAEYADRLMAGRTPEKIDTEPVGTGPFIRVAYQPDSTIRYRANPDYWRGRSKIDDLVFAIAQDPIIRYAKVKAGECHSMAFPNPADLPAMARDPGVKLMTQEGLNVGFLAFNAGKKPFDDVRVRRAFNLAIDKKAVIEAVYGAAGVAASNPIPPTLWSYNSSVKDYPYDPAQAKRLLADAGLGDGFSFNLWAMPIQRPYNPNAKRTAELMQADLAKIGVKATIVTYEWGEYLRRTREMEHDAMLFGFSSDNGDPDNFLHSPLGCLGVKSGFNRAGWCYQPYDDLVVAAKRTTDIAKRTELYVKAQEIFKEQVPWLTLGHSVQVMVLRPEVVDFVMSPFGIHNFYAVDLK
jgi:dipeptide transport system substrate-binding protein